MVSDDRAFALMSGGHAAPDRGFMALFDGEVPEEPKQPEIEPESEEEPEPEEPEMKEKPKPEPKRQIKPETATSKKVVKREKAVRKY